MARFIQDLEALRDRDLGDDCPRIAAVLKRIQDEYDKLPPASILRNQVRPQISTMHHFYLQWNQVSDWDARQPHLDYIKTRRKAITTVVRRHVNIVEAELALDFSSKLFDIMADLPAANVYFPRVKSAVGRAVRDYLPNAPALKRNPKKVPPLDPVREYLLTVRRITSKDFVRRELSSLTNWAKSKLKGFSENQLIAFRAAILRQALVSEKRMTKELIIELSEEALNLSPQGRSVAQA